MIKISVVIPTYKRADLLQTCLKCLNNQTLEKDNFEILVVGDGFDEATQLAVFNYSENSLLNISYWHTNGKKGPAAARNIGWQQATASLIAFTDDDCQPDAGWLAAFLAHYHEEKFKVFSGYTSVPLPAYPTDFALNTAYLEKADFITANCACTRAALTEVGGFDERFKVAWREDSDLAFKLEQYNIPIIKVRNALVIHPVRSAPWGISIREQKKNLYNALLYKKFPQFYRRYIQAQPPWNYYLIVFFTVLLIIFILIQWYYAATTTLILSLILIMTFFFKRIKPLSKTRTNIWEMLVTSFVIPFVAVYWRLYGAAKFRVLFL